MINHERIFIIAGNYQEGINFVKKHNIYPYKIVTSIEQIRGQRDIHGYFVGTWRDLKDIQVILWEIISRTSNADSYNRLITILEHVRGDKFVFMPLATHGTHG